MDSSAPLCPTCVNFLLTDDDDPTFIEAENHQGQPVLLKLETKNSDKYVSAEPDEVFLEDIEWPQFLAGTWQPMTMVPDSCGFCEYLLQLLASETLKEVVRDQEKKSGHTCDAVFVRVERMWSSKGFFIAASFNGIQVSFHFRLSKGPDYDSRDVWTQRFILVPHASSDFPEVGNWLQCHEPVSTRYTDAKYIDWMKHQLAACEQEYPSDETGTTHGFTPRRLLDITAGQVKLAPSANSSISSPLSLGEKCPKYAALSYCWGDPSVASTQITTTKDTEVARQAGIPMDQLTQTLLEAVMICRSLDIPYLWVDALCILQDDDDDNDWNQQCVDMCSIYSNAYVTLCASSSRSCSDGFLGLKGQLFEVPFISRKRKHIRGKYGLHAVFTHSEFFDEDSEMADWDRRGSHWANRGWVLQERFSATRKIIFGDFSLQFECQHAAIEFGKDSPSTPMSSIQYWYLSESFDVPYLVRMWTQLVSSHVYNGTFTRPEDFLPSLSGLASSLKEVCPAAGDYIAGLWTNELHLHLCQFESPLFRMAYRPARAIFFAALGSKGPGAIPSWSLLNARGWSTYVPSNLHSMTSKGLIIFLRHRAEAIIKAEVDHINSFNPFGAIKSALLKVQSLVLDLRHPNLDKLQICDVPGLGSSRDFHEIHAQPHLKNGNRRICKVALDFQCPMGVDASMDLPSMRLLLLGTCKVSRSSDGFLRKGRGAYGLILWPSPTNPQRWRRIGVFFPAAARGWYQEGYRLMKRLGVMEHTVIE